ncbi:hypothetical protein [Streptomyces roseirectus]|nr:hypothetical protein [Streptomyces roseirectus]
MPGQNTGIIPKSQLTFNWAILKFKGNDVTPEEAEEIMGDGSRFR